VKGIIADQTHLGDAVSEWDEELSGAIRFLNVKVL